jgi:hypothetical protein
MNEPSSESQRSGQGRWRNLVFGLVLVAAVVLCFSPALPGDFLWDDDLHITANPTIVGPLGLKEIWTTAAANYFPLVLTNFWVQHALWGLNPFGYHVVTLLFHALAAVLLWRVLLRLNARGAWLGAALWALHPVQVESVAWICELKNTQSAVFFLGAILGWLRWLEVGRVSDPPYGGCDLVAAEGGVDLLGPSLDTAGDVAHARKALGAQILGHPQASAAVMAVDEKVFLARQVAEAFGDLAHRDRLGAGDRADLEFEGLAHVDQVRVGCGGGQEAVRCFDGEFEWDGVGCH